MNAYWSIAVICAFGIGFLAGYWECKIQTRTKEREEAFRLAIKNTIDE